MSVCRLLGEVITETEGSCDAATFRKPRLALPVRKLKRRETDRGDGTVSFKKRKVTSNAIAEKVAGTAQGRK